MSYIQNVKNNYEKELSESIQTLEELISKTTRFYASSETQMIMENISKFMPDLSKDMKTITEGINSANPTLAMKNIDWLAIDSKMRSSDPELREIMERFDKSDAKTVINDMTKELANLSQNTKKDSNQAHC